MRRVLVLAAGVAACSPQQSARDICEEGLCAQGTPTFGESVETDTRAEVQAVAITPDEPPWFAGAYNRGFTIADESWGADDASFNDTFVARTGVRRLAPLVVNNPATYPMRVVGIVPDFEDGVRTFTIGPEGVRQRFDVVWFDRRGSAVWRSTVALVDSAGALGGAAVTTDVHGWPIVAVSGTRITLDTTDYDGTHAMIMRLGQGMRREILIDLGGVDIADLAIDGDLLALGGQYTGAPTLAEGSAPWPACTDPEPCGFIAVMALSSGLVHWVQPIHAPGGAAVHDVAAGSGIVVGMASTATSAATDPPLGTGAIPAYLLTLEGPGADGLPLLLDQTILADTGTEIGGRDVAVADGGNVVISLAYKGSVLVGTNPPAFSDPDANTYASVIAELGTDLIWQWRLFLSSFNIRVTALAVKGDQVVFGGHYRGGFLFLEPVLAELPPDTLQNDPEHGFVLEVHR